MPHQIETAPSGRAKCRHCKLALEKGSLRFGESVPHVYGENEAFHWYHPLCGAERRPEAFLDALGRFEGELPRAEELRHLASIGVEHPRWSRVVRVERASTGRAKCRHCHEAIGKGELRLALEFLEDGMLNPAGFVHPLCTRAYAGTIEGLIERLERTGPIEDRDELVRLLESGPEASPDAPVSDDSSDSD